EDEERVWLTEFTNDRAKIAAALARVPAMCEPNAAAPPPEKTVVKAEGEGKTDDIVSTETIRGRNGAVITREIRRDGTVNVKRTDKDGKVTVEINDIYDMSAAILTAT